MCFVKTVSDSALPATTKVDRVFWVLPSKSWKDWRQALIMVKPETVISWHRRGFRLFWTWISKEEALRPTPG